MPQHIGFSDIGEEVDVNVLQRLGGRGCRGFVPERDKREQVEPEPRALASRDRKPVAVALDQGDFEV